jgi:hypothetical protein
VTVNGRPVDALDASENFFALLPVASGVTALTVQATDAWGQTATADVTLIGVEPPAGEFAFDQAHDTTAAGRLTFEGTFFNRQTQTLHAGMRLTNTGDDLLRAAVLAVFDSISPPEVTLAASEGLTPPSTLGADLATPPGTADQARRGSLDPAETADHARRGSPDPAETADR